jgi:hypothetical protein
VIFDHRIYTFRPGGAPKQIELYDKIGRETQIKHLGEPVLWAQAETGELNTIVHIWAYKDAADRAERRANMGKDPQWGEYLKKTGELGALIAQRNNILQPAPFFTLKPQKPGEGSNKMIFDHRTYTFRPGRVANQMEIYNKYGREAQARNLGAPVLWAFAETGELNTVVHIWAYESAGDRATRRANMGKDPQWGEFGKHSAEAGNLIAQRNSILTSAPFFYYKKD